MDNKNAEHLISTNLFDAFGTLFRRFLFQVLSFGPMPRHIAFIPDGNRRYGRKWNIDEGKVYRMGMTALMSIVKYCYEMGIQCVSVYGFSIDNFKRKPAEVQSIMDLIRENAEALMHDTTVVNELGIQVKFLGDLDMLDESIRAAITKAMDVTATNDKIVLLVCLAYSSTREIVQGVQGSCEERWARARKGKSKVKDESISIEDLEKHMYFAGYPDPDILIRTSGETRLSNFVLWQSTCCLLYAPRCLWPEISLRHLVWAMVLLKEIPIVKSFRIHLYGPIKEGLPLAEIGVIIINLPIPKMYMIVDVRLKQHDI